MEVNGVDHETSSEAESEHATEAEPEAEQPAVDQDREMDVKKRVTKVTKASRDRTTNFDFISTNFSNW